MLNYCTYISTAVRFIFTLYQLLLRGFQVRQETLSSGLLQPAVIES